MAAKQSGIVIIGGGIMGGDIATIFAAGNWAVHVMSPSQKTRDALPGRVSAGLGKIGADASMLKNLKMYDNLEAIAWADIDLVLEAIVKRLDRAYAKLLADALAAGGLRLDRFDLSPATCAQLLLRATSGAAYDATSVASHRRHVKEIVTVILAALR